VVLHVLVVRQAEVPYRLGLSITNFWKHTFKVLPVR